MDNEQAFLAGSNDGKKRKIFIAFDSFTRGKNPCRGFKFPQLLEEG